MRPPRLLHEHPRLLHLHLRAGIRRGRVHLRCHRPLRPGTDLCDPNATCTYTGPGTYDCTCNPGYLGDGFTCTRIEPGVCISANDGPLFDDTQSMAGAGTLAAFRFYTTASLRIRRCEIFTGERFGTDTLAIWSHDYTSNKPHHSLGGASFSTSMVNGWQGVDFAPTILLGGGPDYWVVWGATVWAQASLQSSGTAVENRASHDGGASWTSATAAAWKFRCYCD